MSLTIDDVSHRYAAGTVISKAGFRVEAGEIMCLFGHSGCGKTTLLRIVAGFEPLQQGRIVLDGAVLAEPGRAVPPERRPAGFVFQDYVLFPHLSVEGNVAFGIRREKDAGRRVALQLEATGLEGLAGRFPHELSGGQKQRVALARALVRRPRALLLDEPFASIDVVLRRRLREDMRAILKAQGVCVILVTHDPEEALMLGDRITLMRSGRTIETATPEALFSAPLTPEGAGLFPGCQMMGGQIRGGCMRTPAGTLPAGGLPDGPGVAVFRNRALLAGEDESGSFTVRDVRFSGPGWTVYLEGPSGPPDIRVHMDKRPDPGRRVCIEADPSMTFVYACDSPSCPVEPDDVPS